MNGLPMPASSLRRGTPARTLPRQSYRVQKAFARQGHAARTYDIPRPWKMPELQSPLSMQLVGDSSDYHNPGALPPTRRQMTARDCVPRRGNDVRISMISPARDSKLNVVIRCANRLLRKGSPDTRPERTSATPRRVLLCNIAASAYECEGSADTECRL